MTDHEKGNKIAPTRIDWIVGVQLGSQYVTVQLRIESDVPKALRTTGICRKQTPSSEYGLSLAEDRLLRLSMTDRFHGLPRLSADRAPMVMRKRRLYSNGLYHKRGGHLTETNSFHESEHRPPSFTR